MNSSGLFALGEFAPTIPADGQFWIAPTAHVIGKVELRSGVGIWFGSVLRGDNEPILVGEGSNIQEMCMVHTDPGFPVTLGRNCTVGHRAILHGCTVGDNSLIGMGAIVLNGARIGSNCLIGAGALVTEGTEIPDGSLVVGAPGKVRRELSGEEIAGLTRSAENYQSNMERFRAELRPAG